MAAGEKKENKLIERHGSKKAYEPGREEKKHEKMGAIRIKKLDKITEER